MILTPKENRLSSWTISEDDLWSGAGKSSKSHITNFSDEATSVWSARTQSHLSISSVAMSQQVSGSRICEIGNVEKRSRRRTIAIMERKNLSVSHDSVRADSACDNRTSISSVSTHHTMAIADDTEELPPTQPRGPLRDIVAYVEVNSGMENRSVYVGNVLRDLGAVVSQRLTMKVTHVVFREGRQSTYEKALCRNVHLVSILWVDACHRNRERANEAAYPVDNQITPGISCNSVRRPRFLQPSTYDLSTKLSDNYLKQRAKRAESYRTKKHLTKLVYGDKKKPTSMGGANAVSPILLSPVASCTELLPMPKPAPAESCTPESLLTQLQSLRRKIAEMAATPYESDSPERETLSQSVRRRLYGDGAEFHGQSPPSYLQRDHSLPSKDTTSKDNEPPREAERQIQGDVVLPTRLEFEESVCEFIPSDRHSDVTTTGSLGVTEIRKKSVANVEQSTVACNTSDVVPVPASSSNIPSRKPIHRAAKKKDNVAKKTKAIKSSRIKESEKKVKKAKTASGPVMRKADAVNSDQDSMMDTAINSVCRRHLSDIWSKRGKGSVKRRLFDPNDHRLSDTIANADDMDIGLSLTARMANPSDNTILGDVFLAESSEESNKKTKQAAKKATKRKTSTKPKEGGKKRRGEQGMLRFRSSIFNVKSASAAVRKAQEGRPSGEDFEPYLKNLLKPRRGKASTRKETSPVPVKRRRKPTRGLAVTNLSNTDRDLVRAIVKRLGGFRLETKVSLKTTHLICGSSNRTLNVLSAAARGCWILSLDWVIRSLSSGCWIAEEFYELPEFFVSEKIRHRGLELHARSSQLFKTLGVFYVDRDCQPPHGELCTLIKWSGGKIIESSKRATYYIGGSKKKGNTMHVKELWILDSIMKQSVLPINEYLL